MGYVAICTSIGGETPLAAIRTAYLVCETDFAEVHRLDGTEHTTATAHAGDWRYVTHHNCKGSVARALAIASIGHGDYRDERAGARVCDKPRVRWTD